MRSQRTQNRIPFSEPQHLHVEGSARQASNFGKHVLNRSKLENYLNQNACKALDRCIRKNISISNELADQIASAMKAWAISLGATHYTHWFQPLSGATAEKQDSFFDLDFKGNLIEKFEGVQLVQQQPDVSFAPSGGARNTFEGRGYTLWDPTSPPFIYDDALCIPTLFVSFTGESLDYKTPLLKSLKVLDEASTEVCKYFDKNVAKVQATLGWEQEFFLIDASIALTRPDLILTGRTLLGHAPAKGKHLGKHYFGAIPNRVLTFLKDLEQACFHLGIPIKTRHNELAPSQFELTPVFEEANLSIDHNSLLMDLMSKLATKHHFMVIFHEKPFANINGSGKHNNWSLATNTGLNLLSPSKTPMGNLQFLTFFINTIAAVLKHEALVSAATISASNDLRLGSNEAPPSFISIFIGKELTKVLEELENVSKGKLSPQEKTDLKLNVIGKIPEILLDNTDQTRTSPIAFTGNKFEYRAVGANTHCAKPITVLNSAVAEQLLDFKETVDVLVNEKNMKKDDAIFNVLRDMIKHIKNILNEGDEKSTKKTEKKASKHNQRSVPDLLSAYTSDSSIALFEKLEIFTQKELLERYAIDLNDYVQTLQIESRALGDIARNHIIPTSIKYQNIIIENIRGLKEIYGDQFKTFGQEQLTILEEISAHITEINKSVNAMIGAREKSADWEDVYKKALVYSKEIMPFLEHIRTHCDALELTIDDEIWPLAKYRELLFIR